MKLLFIIIIVYNIMNIAYSNYRYREKSLSKGAIANLIFSFLLYIDLLINKISGFNSNTFVLGIAICWLVAYAIVYVSKKMAHH